MMELSRQQRQRLLRQPLYTTGAIATLCRVAPRTVSKWFDAGRIKGYRIPGSQDRRVPREELLRFAREHGMDGLAAEMGAGVPGVVVHALPDGVQGKILAELGHWSAMVAADTFDLGRMVDIPDVMAVVIGPANGGYRHVSRLVSRLGDVCPGLTRIAVLGEDEASQTIPAADATFHLPCDWAAVADAVRGEVPA